MKERGIICKADEVRQLLASRRGPMSRVIRAPPDASDAAMSPHWKRLPLGNVGDHLYVREAFWIEHDYDTPEMAPSFDCGVNIAEDSDMRVQYCATPKNHDEPDEPGEWWGPDEIFNERSWIAWGLHSMGPFFFSKHSGAIMPRWASRITLEVVQSIVQTIDGEWVQTVTVKRIDKAGVK